MSVENRDMVEPVIIEPLTVTYAPVRRDAASEPEGGTYHANHCIQIRHAEKKQIRQWRGLNALVLIQDIVC